LPKPIALKLSYRQQNLPFEYPFTISNGRTKTHQPHWWLRWNWGHFIGFGEAPAIVYYGVTVEK
jgi:hypothetical protein